MSNFKRLIEDRGQQCPRQYILALRDTLAILNGKWKLPIIATLLRGNNRFKDLRESIHRITPRMLSKELKELEVNGVVERKVHPYPANLIEYRLTESGRDIATVIDALIDWGLAHRSAVMKAE